MKKVLSFILLSVFAMSVYAAKGFEPTVKMTGAIGIDGNKNNAFGIEFIASYRVNNYFRIGAGTGISYCNLLFDKGGYNPYLNIYINKYRESEAFVPLFVNLKANFIGKGISPYFSLSGGYSFLVPFSKYAKNAKLGLMVNPALGVDFPLSKGSIFVEVGYKYQAMNYNGYDRNEDFNHSQATVSLGYNF